MAVKQHMCPLMSASTKHKRPFFAFPYYIDALSGCYGRMFFTHQSYKYCFFSSSFFNCWMADDIFFFNDIFFCSLIHQNSIIAVEARSRCTSVGWHTLNGITRHQWFDESTGSFFYSPSFWARIVHAVSLSAIRTQFLLTNGLRVNANSNSITHTHTIHSQVLFFSCCSMDLLNF